MDVSGQHTFWPLFLQERTLVPSNRRLGGARLKILKEKNSLARARIKNPQACTAHNLVTILIMQSWLPLSPTNPTTFPPLTRLLQPPLFILSNDKRTATFQNNVLFYAITIYSYAYV